MLDTILKGVWFILALLCVACFLLTLKGLMFGSYTFNIMYPIGFVVTLILIYFIDKRVGIYK